MYILTKYSFTFYILGKGGGLSFLLLCFSIKETLAFF